MSKGTDWSDSFVVAEEAPCVNLSPVVTEVSLRLQSALMVFLQLVWAQKSGPDLATDESRSVSPGRGWGGGWWGLAGKVLTEFFSVYGVIRLDPGSNFLSAWRNSLSLKRSAP